MSLLNLITRTFRRGIRRLSSTLPSKYRAIVEPEEKEAIKNNETEVLELLLDIDEYLADDGLLDGLSNALIKERPEPEKAFCFIWRILERRLQINEIRQSFKAVDRLDLQRLGQQVPCMDSGGRILE